MAQPMRELRADPSMPRAYVEVRQRAFFWTNQALWSNTRGDVQSVLVSTSISDV
jgi:hypothetical protein